jgi:Na+-transporting methylmalonyl-CoA/oxaloacetate decarboxylase gamma subunit
MDTLKTVNMLTIFGVSIVLYFLKLLSGNRNF